MSSPNEHESLLWNYLHAGSSTKGSFIDVPEINVVYGYSGTAGILSSLATNVSFSTAYYYAIQ